MYLNPFQSNLQVVEENVCAHWRTNQQYLKFCLVFITRFVDLHLDSSLERKTQTNFFDTDCTNGSGCVNHSLRRESVCGFRS